VAAHQRKKRTAQSKDGDKQDLFFDETVPVEEIKVSNPEAEGLREDDYEVVSQKTSYRLAQRPGVYRRNSKRSGEDHRRDADKGGA
jgi:transposase